METKEIDKLLKDKNISPELRKSLEKRKEILTNNTTVEK
jgi:hypothetical protein